MSTEIQITPFLASSQQPVRYIPEQPVYKVPSEPGNLEVSSQVTLSSFSAQVRFKKIDPAASSPVRSTSGAAGYDLTATKIALEDGLLVAHTGLALELPAGYVGILFPRSSISKYTLQLSNAVGVLDADYRGEVLFKFRYVYSGQSTVYKVGDRVGQLVVLKLPEVELTEVTELTSTSRGAGGYGSTGR